MIDDAQVGEKPAMVNDAQILSDRLLSPGQEESVAEVAPEPQLIEAQPAEQSEGVSETPQEPVEETPDPDEVNHEAQGRAAVEMGQPRSANPYDRRKAEGKAWYRGWDSAGGGSKE